MKDAVKWVWQHVNWAGKIILSYCAVMLLILFIGNPWSPFFGIATLLYVVTILPAAGLMFFVDYKD